MLVCNSDNEDMILFNGIKMFMRKFQTITDVALNYFEYTNAQSPIYL